MQLLFRALKNWALQVHVAKDNSIVGDGRIYFLIFKTDFRFNAAGPVFVRQYSLENKNSYEKRNYVKLFSTF